jgi:hypothetical protein
VPQNNVFDPIGLVAFKWLGRSVLFLMKLVNRLFMVFCVWTGSAVVCTLVKDALDAGSDVIVDVTDDVAVVVETVVTTTGGVDPKSSKSTKINDNHYGDKYYYPWRSLPND